MALRGKKSKTSTKTSESKTSSKKKEAPSGGSLRGAAARDAFARDDEERKARRADWEGQVRDYFMGQGETHGAKEPVITFLDGAWTSRKVWTSRSSTSTRSSTRGLGPSTATRSAAATTRKRTRCARCATPATTPTRSAS